VFDTTHSFCALCTGSGLDYITPGDSATVPEPSTALMLISGFAVLPFVRRRREKV